MNSGMSPAAIFRGRLCFFISASSGKGLNWGFSICCSTRGNAVSCGISICCSTPLRRSFEQEADRRIVEYFGRDHQLEAMARTAMCSRIIAGDRTLQQLMMTHSAEEIDFAAAIRSALTRECSYDECRNGLTAALAEIPPVFDELPPFRERVGK